MQKRFTHILKPVCFSLILLLLTLLISPVLQQKWIEYGSLGDTYVAEGFYDLEKNSIELAVMGSSQTIRSFSCMHLLENYGISAYSPSSGTQPMACTYYYAKRLLKTQQLKAVLIDVSSLYEEVNSSQFNRVTDLAPLSLDKLALLADSSKIIMHKNGKKAAVKHLWTHLLPIIQYHDRWSDLTAADFGLTEEAPFVLRGNTSRLKIKKQKGILVKEGQIDEYDLMQEDQRIYLEKTIQLFQDAGVRVTLIKTPKKDWTYTRMLGASEVAEQYGVDFLDFNTKKLFEAAGLSTKKDFADQEHLNLNGALKLTDYLAEYLSDKVSFNQAVLTEKDAADLAVFHRILEQNRMVTTADPEEFLSLLDDPDYEVFVMYGTDAAEPAYRQLDGALAQAGLTGGLDAAAGVNYAAHIKGGTVEFEELSESAVDYDTEMRNGKTVSLRCNYAKADGTTLLAGDEAAEIKNQGIHIFVFDQTRDLVQRGVTIAENSKGKLVLKTIKMTAEDEE